MPVLRFHDEEAFRTDQIYEEWLEPYLVSNTLELLDKEIPRLTEKNQICAVVFFN
jgi:hypothetical protein